MQRVSHMNRVQMNVRIDKNLRDQLFEIACSQNRSLSNCVENELKQVVEKYRLADFASRSRDG